MPFENLPSPTLPNKAFFLLRAILQGGTVSFKTRHETCTKEEAQGENLQRRIENVRGVTVGRTVFGKGAFNELLGRGIVTEEGDLADGMRERYKGIADAPALMGKRGVVDISKFVFLPENASVNLAATSALAAD